MWDHRTLEFKSLIIYHQAQLSVTQYCNKPHLKSYRHSLLSSSYLNIIFNIYNQAHKCPVFTLYYNKPLFIVAPAPLLIKHSKVRIFLHPKV